MSDLYPFLFLNFYGPQITPGRLSGMKSGGKGSSGKSHGVICGVIWYLYHLRPGWLHFKSNLVKDEKPSSSAISYRNKYNPFLFIYPNQAGVVKYPKTFALGLLYSQS